MPPRSIRLSSPLVQNVCQNTARQGAHLPPFRSSFICLNQTCDASTSSAPKRKHRDAYALAQARARKAANISRREVLQQERIQAAGDPVRGTTTPLVESFDHASPFLPSTSSFSVEEQRKFAALESGSTPLNFYLTEKELDESIKRSVWLSTPDKSSPSGQLLNPDKTEAQIEAQRKVQQTAEEAVRRIAALSIGTSKDRLRANKQRCIDIFGRHRTDSQLQPQIEALKAGSASAQTQTQEATPRAGPDTGSSEVQVAILTAKIRALANAIDTRGKKDHANKRNLRLLVHRRAKLLKYLRRKDHGGPRWQRVTELLGLDEGTWKGEIVV